MAGERIRAWLAQATQRAGPIAAISSAVLMRRAARRASSASTISALGNASGSKAAKVGVIVSVPTRRAVAAPSIFFKTSMSVIAFQASPYK